MQWIEVLRDIWSTRRLRFLGAVAGMLVSIGLTVCLGHITRALWRELTAGLEEAGSQIIFVVPNQQRLLVGEEVIGLSDHDASLLERRVAGVEFVTRTLSIQGAIDTCGTRLLVQIVGVLPLHRRLDRWTMREGRFITELDIEKATPVIVADETVMRTFGCLRTDSAVPLSGAMFRVVGVAASQSSIIRPPRAGMVLMPLSTARARYDTGLRSRGGAMIVVRRHASVQQVKQRIADLLHGTYAKRGDKEPAFIVEVQAVTLSRLEAMGANVLALVMLVIGAGVVIAVGNVINTVYASVVERFRELGIRRCVGASRTQIQRLIVIEALWLWLVGSLSGVAAGWGAYVSAAHAWGFSIFVDWTIVCTAVGIALVLTLVGATWPAVMATRLTPIEALSRE